MFTQKFYIDRRVPFGRFVGSKWAHLNDITNTANVTADKRQDGRLGTYLLISAQKSFQVERAMAMLKNHQVDVLHRSRRSSMRGVYSTSASGRNSVIGRTKVARVGSAQRRLSKTATVQSTRNSFAGFTNPAFAALEKFQEELRSARQEPKSQKTAKSSDYVAFPVQNIRTRKAAKKQKKKKKKTTNSVTFEGGMICLSPSTTPSVASVGSSSAVESAAPCSVTSGPSSTETESTMPSTKLALETIPSGKTLSRSLSDDEVAALPPLALTKSRGKKKRRRRAGKKERKRRRSQLQKAAMVAPPPSVTSEVPSECSLLTETVVFETLSTTGESTIMESLSSVTQPSTTVTQDEQPSMTQELASTQVEEVDLEEVPDLPEDDAADAQMVAELCRRQETLLDRLQKLLREVDALKPKEPNMELLQAHLVSSRYSRLLAEETLLSETVATVQERLISELLEEQESRALDEVEEERLRLQMEEIERQRRESLERAERASRERQALLLELMRAQENCVEEEEDIEESVEKSIEDSVVSSYSTRSTDGMAGWTVQDAEAQDENSESDSMTVQLGPLPPCLLNQDTNTSVSALEEQLKKKEEEIELAQREAIQAKKKLVSLELLKSPMFQRGRQRFGASGKSPLLGPQQRSFEPSKEQLELIRLKRKEIAALKKDTKRKNTHFYSVKVTVIRAQTSFEHNRVEIKPYGKNKLVKKSFETSELRGTTNPEFNEVFTVLNRYNPSGSKKKVPTSLKFKVRSGKKTVGYVMCDLEKYWNNTMHSQLFQIKAKKDNSGNVKGQLTVVIEAKHEVHDALVDATNSLNEYLEPWCQYKVGDEMQVQIKGVPGLDWVPAQITAIEDVQKYRFRITDSAVSLRLFGPKRRKDTDVHIASEDEFRRPARKYSNFSESSEDSLDELPPMMMPARRHTSAHYCAGEILEVQMMNQGESLGWTDAKVLTANPNGTYRIKFLAQTFQWEQGSLNLAGRELDNVQSKDLRPRPHRGQWRRTSVFDYLTDLNSKNMDSRSSAAW